MARKEGDMPPTPKRSSERRRRNKESKPDKVVAVGVVKVPPVARGWHPVAKRWYRALGESGQAQFFEPSDWAAAFFVAEAMTLYFKVPRASAFSAIWTAMGDLLTTEAQRRRVRVEVERSPDTSARDAGVTAMADYRKRLGA